MNSLEPDFKVDFLHPVPLRIMEEGKDVEKMIPACIIDAAQHIYAPQK